LAQAVALQLHNLFSGSKQVFFDNLNVLVFLGRIITGWFKINVRRAFEMLLIFKIIKIATDILRRRHKAVIKLS